MSIFRLKLVEGNPRKKLWVKGSCHVQRQAVSLSASYPGVSGVWQRVHRSTMGNHSRDSLPPEEVISSVSKPRKGEKRTR